jgi:hypothetical protein
LARRQRIDSKTAAVETMGRALQPVEPPSNVPLDDCDLPFFASVIAEFARSEWTAHQLELAALLARTMSDMARNQMELREEGEVVVTERGTPVVNPRKSVVQMHAGTILSIRRSLSLHARAKGGEQRDVGKRRLIVKEIESDNPLEEDDDGLLARPVFN